MADSRALVCAVITNETTAAARQSLRDAARVADLAEIRLDYLRDFDFHDFESLKALLEEKPLPVIITCRAAAEGGQQHVEDSVRLRLLVEGARQLAEFCDIEASAFEAAASLAPDFSKLIVSWHNFEETPSDLDAVYDRITSLPAAVHKIVTHANDFSDSLTIFRLLDRAKRENRKLIALAMGQRGLITRVVGPGRGSFLTYGSIARGGESAAGQPTCDELINLYRVRSLTANCRIVGIVGNPLGHSASPVMQNRALGELDLDCVYLPFETGNLGSFFESFGRSQSPDLAESLLGFSVTIPYKADVIPFLDVIDATAEEVGAVNTVANKGGQLIGYNTDVSAAIEPLARVCSLSSEHCAVVGAGGASRAVVYGLRQRGARVTVFARDPARARQLGERFGAAVEPLDMIAACDASILINTTPIGMRGHSEGESPVPPNALSNRRIVYDLVYNPPETRLLAEARTLGCLTIGGIEMLVAQGVAQFELWMGQKPTAGNMHAAVMDWLSRVDS